MSSITIKQGESKTVAFLIKRNGVALDLSGLSPAPTFKWAVKKEREDATYLIEKSDSDFDKSDWANGYVKINVLASDTQNMGVGTYLSELKTIFDVADDIDKSAEIDFNLEQAVIHD